MQPIKHKNILKFSLTVFVILGALNVAHSSIYNSGKTKKRASAKSSLTFNIHNKSLNFSYNSGYHFKGGITNLKNSKSGITLHMHSIYFQKGNNLYVLPYSQKVIILNKFKTPQKPY
jgi:hypothetical protein